MCYVCACACMHYLCMHLFFGFQSLPSIDHASETKLLGNNAGTSVDFTARHLRTPSCGTFARKIVLVISACQAAEPSLGTSAPRRVFNLRQSTQAANLRSDTAAPTKLRSEPLRQVAFVTSMCFRKQRQREVQSSRNCEVTRPSVNQISNHDFCLIN